MKPALPAGVDMEPQWCHARTKNLAETEAVGLLLACWSCEVLHRSRLHWFTANNCEHKFQVHRRSGPDQCILLKRNTALMTRNQHNRHNPPGIFCQTKRVRPPKSAQVAAGFGPGLLMEAPHPKRYPTSTNMACNILCNYIKLLLNMYKTYLATM